MNDLHVELPLLPRLAKWLRVHYRHLPQLVPTPHDPRLAQLWAIFQTPAVGKFRHREPPAGVIRVKVSYRQYDASRARYTRFSPVEIQTINVLLDTYLYGEFFQLARQVANSGGTARQAAREFCDRYDFTEGELSEETLKRAYNRHNQHNTPIGFPDGLIASLCSTL